MKKFLITTIIFMLALTVVANDELYKMVYQIPLDLSIGIEQPKEAKLNDFTTVMAPVAPVRLVTSSGAEEYIDEHFSDWYKYDFAEDPFDGRLELLVMGEPLPTPLTTLLVALGTIGIILMNNNRWSKQEKTLR